MDKDDDRPISSMEFELTMECQGYCQVLLAIAVF